MIKTSKQLKDLIRNLSKKKSANAQVLMRNYMMERFLERVSLSEYRDKFILKGGMLVAAMVGLDARSTMDMDATVNGMILNEESIKIIIDRILSVPVEDGVSFQVKNISNIMDEADYPGVRISMSAFFDGTVTPIKIDISTGDIITPQAIQYCFKLMLEERSISLRAYNLETILAEKLESVISRATTNTRMRDFYDIYVLSKMYQDTLDTDILRQAVVATSHKRQTEHMLSEGDEILREVETDTVMQKLWESYQKKFPYAAGIKWSETIQTIRNLYGMTKWLAMRETIETEACSTTKQQEITTSRQGRKRR